MATSYANRGGTGERRQDIAVTTTAAGGAGAITDILDGSQANSYWFTNGQSGKEILFDFGAGVAAIIDEFTFYQSAAQTQGTWTIRASPDNSTWTSLATGLNLGGGSATDVHAFTNSTGYRYYSLLQTAGTTSSSPYIREIEFKIDGMPAVLSVEGAATADFSSGGTSKAINITTLGTNRIVVVHVASEASTLRTVTGVSATGLTFAKRKALVVGDSHNTGVEVWWAYASAQLTAAAITVSMSGAVDSAAVGVFAVSGVNNFANPWDANVALPATNHDTGAGSTVQVTGVSTTAANCAVFGFYGASTGSNPGNSTSPLYPQISFDTNWNGSNRIGLFSEWRRFSAAQTSITVGTTIGTLTNWGMIADAITDASGSDPGTWASTEAVDTLAGTGTKTHTGTMAPTEATDTMAGSGGRANGWNPLDISSGATLSGDNLIATCNNGANSQGVRGTIGHSSGKWHIEYTTMFFASVGGAGGVGIANLSDSLTESTAGAYSNTDAASLSLGKTIEVGNAAKGNSGIINDLTGSNVVGVDVDMDAGLVWFTTDGVHWNNGGTANPATGVGGYSLTSGTPMGTAYPKAWLRWGLGGVPYDTVTINGGTSTFAYSIPSGFYAWNSLAPDPGTWAVTEATDVFAGTGTKTHNAAWSSNEAVDVFAGTGHKGHNAAWASTEAADVSSGAGYLGATGSMDATEDPDIADITGGPMSFAGVIGYLGPTEATDVFDGLGYPVVVAVMAVTEESDQFHGFGKITITGTFTPTEAKDVFAGVGRVPGQTGIWASNEPVDRMSVTGKVPRVGTWASTENRDIASFTGLGSTGFTARRIFFVT